MKPHAIWVIAGMVTAVLALSMSFAVARASDLRLEPTEQWNPADPTYIPFDDAGITISSDGRFAHVLADEKRQPHVPGQPPPPLGEFTHYLLDLTTGYHRKLPPLGNGALVTPAPFGHQFLVEGFPNWRLMLFDGLELVRSFDIGDASFAIWNQNEQSRSILFEAGRPIDGDGFNVLGLLNIDTGKVVRIRLRNTVQHYASCRLDGHIYVERPSAGSKKYWSYDEYDGEGHFLGAHDNPGGIPSANCRYVATFSAEATHGPDNWAIYDLRSGELVANFAWKEPDYILFRGWNPALDNLLLLSVLSDGGKIERLKLLDVQKGAALMQWIESEKDSPRDFSGDGVSLVTFRNRHIVFQPIPEDLLNSRP